ncbi:MAG: hypothetical protein COV45_01785 [Deltaproteobacteria bacterium CG11_big_fil_rev_8_21_14_0_20_47_16]|nr:MAG: hypothetical protein COV45_01785 [Deltaproteobacteria bacterium CG11_big_fil_rev_8_21_14_0_20_47_16]
MALQQQFTWKDFLKANPEFKAKQIKRTSEEGKKAFEAAYKKHIKDYLKTRLTAQESTLKKITEGRDAWVKKLKATKKPTKVRILQTKVGGRDAAIHRTKKAIERTKSAQKHF